MSTSLAGACHRPPTAHPRRHGCAQPGGRHRITRSYGAARRPLHSRQPGPFVRGNRCGPSPLRQQPPRRPSHQVSPRRSPLALACVPLQRSHSSSGLGSLSGRRVARQSPGSAHRPTTGSTVTQRPRRPVRGGQPSAPTARRSGSGQRPQDGRPPPLSLQRGRDLCRSTRISFGPSSVDDLSQDRIEGPPGRSS